MNEIPGSTTTRLQIGGMNCGACAGHVQRALASVPGVTSAEVDLASARATVEHEANLDRQKLVAAVAEEDYTASLVG